MMAYNPPTKVTSRNMPYRALVTQIDPDFERAKHREIEYAFSRRAFFGDPDQRGANNRRSNVYAVGQNYGGLDSAVEAALAPTVGNSVPGLYKKVDA